MKINTTETIDAIGQLDFNGNVIPHTWYQHITKQVKVRGSDEYEYRPYLEAIVILSDIVYWYRPTVKRNEETGQIESIEKKFKADKLQRSYQQLADMFGLGKDQAKNAVKHLESLGLITLEFRTIEVNGLILTNVLFIEPVPGAIAIVNKPKTEENTLCPNQDTPMPKLGHTYAQASQGGVPKSEGTYTEITTKTSHKELGAKNAPSDESLASSDANHSDDSPLTILLTDDTDMEANCPKCDKSIVLKNIHKTRAACPHCGVGLYVKNCDGEIVCKPPQSMRENRRRNRLIDLFPCPDEWADFPYYARDKAAFKLLYETAKDDLLSALAWSIGEYSKGKMRYKDAVSAAIKATQKRLSVRQSVPMSTVDKPETSIARMARESGLTEQQIMERLKVGGYVQS